MRSFDHSRITAVVNLTVVPHSSHSWRTLFWVAAGISFFGACVRAVLPESEIFLRAQEARRRKGGQALSATNKTKVFFQEAKVMLKEHWMLSIYAILLMTGTVPLG
jgi:MFS transporter, SHS family, lactate transporter